MAVDIRPHIKPAPRLTAFVVVVDLVQQAAAIGFERTMTDDPSWEGEKRRIDAEFLRDQLGDDCHRSRI